MMRYYLSGPEDSYRVEEEVAPPRPAPVPVVVTPRPAPVPVLPPPASPVAQAAAAQQRAAQTVIIGNMIQNIRAQEKDAQILRARAFAIDSDEVAEKNLRAWKQQMESMLKAQADAAATVQDKARVYREIENKLSPQAVESMRKHFADEAEAAIDTLNAKARRMEEASRQASKDIQDKYGVQAFREGFKAAIAAGNQAVTEAGVLNLTLEQE